MIFPTVSMGRELGNSSVGGSGLESLMCLQSSVSWGCTRRRAPLQDPYPSGSLTQVASGCWRSPRRAFLSAIVSVPKICSWLPPEWTMPEARLTGPCLSGPSLGPSRHFYSILLLTQAALVQCGRAYTKAWVPGGVAHWGHVRCCYHQRSSSQMLQAKLSAHWHSQAAGDPPSSNLCIFEWNWRIF